MRAEKDTRRSVTQLDGAMYQLLVNLAEVLMVDSAEASMADALAALMVVDVRVVAKMAVEVDVLLLNIVNGDSFVEIDNNSTLE